MNAHLKTVNYILSSVATTKMKILITAIKTSEGQLSMSGKIHKLIQKNFIRLYMPPPMDQSFGNGKHEPDVPEESN